ncbi:MAG: sterol desaturase family protein [Hyphomonadaceae bacterium]|nr:sterol desaturase family protein [Hyphomonadaceae bacterium]
MSADELAQLEPYIRLGSFAATLTIMVLAEALWPRRARVRPRIRRWPTNLALVGAGSLIARLLGAAPAPLVAGAAAVWASTHGIGIFNVLAAPSLISILACIAALDLLVWVQHWAFHRVAWLWPLHRVHHGDRDVDASTALRFHPAEILLSALLKAAAAIFLGAPLVAVIVFEVLLNGCAIFNHANISLPRGAERAIRLVLVTPDLHRIHHSVRAEEHNSNYGFCLSIWDRLFRTLTRSAGSIEAPLILGLSDLQDKRPERLSWSLIAPFNWSRP